MTPAMIFVILTLIIPLVLLFTGKLREDVAAIVMMVSLMIAQTFGLPVLGPSNDPNAAEIALKGFGSSTILTLIAIFIITTSLEKYGLTSWISHKLISVSGQSERLLIGLYSLIAALISMVINNLAAGALLLPSALETSKRTGIKPSKLLIPISIGTMLGGAAFYLSTANIIVSGLLPSAVPPQEPLGILDFTPTGLTVAISGVAFLTLFGTNLLPDREPNVAYKIPDNLGLTQTYQLQERLWEIRLPINSSFHNKTIAETKLGENLGISIIAIRRDNHILPIENANFLLQQEDVLIIIGREERVLKLSELGLEIIKSGPDCSYESGNLVFAEAIVPPHSSTEGKTIRDLALRNRCGFSAIALWRNNHIYRTDIAEFRLKAGDALLLIGPADNLHRLKEIHDIVVLETAINRHGMDKPKVLISISVLLASIVAMILGMPIVVAMLAAALILLLMGLVTMEEAYQSIQWRALFLIAGMMSVSTAMFYTGLANLIGNSIVKIVAPWGSTGLLIGTILGTAGLSQLIGSQIAPLITGPIFISAAIKLGINTQAIAVVTGISTAIFFLTPLSHPVHLIMMSPANYRFKDFFKIGIWVSMVCFITLIIATKIFWKI